MKYPIRKIDANQWLNIINAEANPDTEAYQLDYFQVGNKYAAHLSSGLGSFKSELFSAKTAKDTDAKFEKITKDLEAAYNEKKGYLSQYNSLLIGRSRK
jgi:hypothetical protein